MASLYYVITDKGIALEQHYQDKAMDIVSEGFESEQGAKNWKNVAMRVVILDVLSRKTSPINWHQLLLSIHEDLRWPKEDLWETLTWLVEKGYVQAFIGKLRNRGGKD